MHVLAKDDRDSIDRRVRIPWIIYRPYFDGNEPYIDFVFSVFNNSLFDLVIDNSIKGDIWSDSFDQPLHYEPKFFPARPIVCGSRSGTNFVIRHALRVEEVSRFEGKEILIWFDGLEITFSGTGQLPEIGATKLDTKGFCLETKKGAYRNPNDKDEFAFLHTDEQWALLATKPEVIALPTGQSETEKALIESRTEVTDLQCALTKATEANEEKDRKLDSLNAQLSATEIAPRSDVKLGKIHCSVMNSETGERLRASVVAENDVTRKTYKDVADRTGGLELPVPFGSYSVTISADGYHTRVCAANVDNEHGATLHVRLEMLEEKRSEVFKGQRERTIAELERCIRGGTDLLNGIMKAQDSMDAEVGLWETKTATYLTTRIGKYYADIFLNDKNMPEFQPHQGKPYHANLTRVNARVHKLVELMASLQQQLEHDMY